MRNRKYIRTAKCPGSMKEVSFRKDLLDTTDLTLFNDIFFVKFSEPWLVKANRSLQKANKHNDTMEYFEGFIYLWIIFNSWLRYICKDHSKTENDRYLIESAGCDDSLNKLFDEKKISDTGIYKNVELFVNLLPIFKARIIRDLDIEPWDGDVNTRVAFRNKCFSKEDEGYFTYPNDYSPRCYRLHDENRESLPDDWAHVLRAIYAVRCDLFHGGKSLIYSGDKVFVELAFKILWDIWGEDQLTICLSK